MAMRRRDVFAGLLLVLLTVFSASAGAQTPADSLTLHPPPRIDLVPLMNSNRAQFVNYVFWQEVPKDQGVLIHEPDTTGWRAPGSSTPQAELSVPLLGGSYTGGIDRTISFLAKNSGVVGETDSFVVRYDILGEEEFQNTVNLGGNFKVIVGTDTLDSSYTPGSSIPLVFRSSLTGETLDLGLEIAFSAGKIDSNGVFSVCIEDFEGYHVWRGIRPDGSDLEIIGEMSREEAFHGSDFDSLYYHVIIPELRRVGHYTLPIIVPGLGSEIDIRNVHPDGRLGDNELAWFDRNAFNGFTYYYTVTSYDRGYQCKSRAQGLIKFDHCQPAVGSQYPCPDELVSVANEVSPQNQLTSIYVVPNPYRSGTSQFSAENYHNFPDNMMRFVNLPADCELGIYTPSGDLVWWYEHRDGPGTVAWNTRNQAGEEVASGVYIYRVQVPNGEGMFGRIVIIR